MCSTSTATARIERCTRTVGSGLLDRPISTAKEDFHRCVNVDRWLARAGRRIAPVPGGVVVLEASKHWALDTAQARTLHYNRVSAVVRSPSPLGRPPTALRDRRALPSTAYDWLRSPGD